MQRLEAIERNEAAAGPPAASGLPLGTGTGAWMAPAGKSGREIRNRKSIAPAAAAASADQVLAQLAEMNNEIDNMRARKRERTPPEKHVVGGAALDME